MTSAKDQGVQTIPVIIGKDSFTVMTFWPTGPTIEIYSFWKDNDGQNKFSLSQVLKGGLIHKQSLLIGN